MRQMPYTMSICVDLSLTLFRILRASRRAHSLRRNHSLHPPQMLPIPLPRVQQGSPPVWHARDSAEPLRRSIHLPFLHLSKKTRQNFDVGMLSHEKDQPATRATTSRGSLGGSTRGLHQVAALGGGGRGNGKRKKFKRPAELREENSPVHKEQLLNA